jgi:SpoVK/Ycf46/Vps4 family AAA+-type ATPase
MPFFDWSLTRGLVRVPGTAAYYATEDPLMVLKHIDTLTVEAIFHLKDFADHLQNAALRRTLRELCQKFRPSRSTVVITGDPIELPRDLDQIAVKIDFQLPNDDELRLLLSSVVRSLRKHGAVDVKLGKDDLEGLIRALRGLTLGQARQALSLAIIEDRQLTAADIGRVIKKKGQMIEQGGLLEYYPLESNEFELGGFGRLKSWLEKARIGFTTEARDLNLPPPRGVLFVGVQGCGKSLAAKYIARNWQLPLLKLDGGRLYDKYIGETERNFRRAIALAESMAPVVLWIDEIEKVFVPTGTSESDAGLSRRMFGSFLTWLQEKKKDVFVVGAANDLSIVPPELLRKGRFDEIFFVDLPDESERETIFRIHLTRRRQKPEGFDLARLVKATEGFSGAEIEQIVISSLYRSLQHKTPLTTETLLEEISQTIPLSVSRHEDINEIRDMARDRFVPVR